VTSKVVRQCDFDIEVVNLSDLSENERALDQPLYPVSVKNGIVLEPIVYLEA
jgi:hypothetical protein